MAKEKQVGVEIVADAIKSGVPAPIPLDKLLIDDFTGEGGKALLDGRKQNTYQPPEPVHAPDLGTAFEHFKPAQVIEVPRLDDPREKTRYRVSFRGLEDFEPAQYEKRIPELQALAAEEQGLEQLLGFLDTGDGANRLRELLADEGLRDKLESLRVYFEDYLGRIEQVLSELRDDSQEPPQQKGTRP